MSTYLRTWALDDIVIRSGGDGRTVEAYAAIFDTPYEVRDQHGHYMERIDRSAFNRTLQHGIHKVAVLYNHGLTVHGTPSDLGSVPIGTPLEIRPDGRGLYTVTRYNRSELADAVLEAIRNGDIRAQSFRGRIFRSSPERAPRAPRGGALPVVVRHELGLSDYGPTPVPVNDSAAILAVRSLAHLVDDIDRIDEMDDAKRLELLAELARHLPGRHRRGAHGNRYRTPGDRSSGLRRKGASKLDPPDDDDELTESTNPLVIQYTQQKRERAERERAERERAESEAADAAELFDGETASATPADAGPGAEDPPVWHSGRQMSEIKRRIGVARITRSMR